MEDITRSPLYSEDLAPIPPDKRTWSKWNLAALWVGMAVCIPTYILASYMMRAGLSWQAALTIIGLGESGDHHSDGAEWPCRCEVWYSISGAGARGIRYGGHPYSEHCSGYRGLRLVRRTDLDRWLGDLFHLERRDWCSQAIRD